MSNAPSNWWYLVSIACSPIAAFGYADQANAWAKQHYAGKSWTVDRIAVPDCTKLEVVDCVECKGVGKVTRRRGDSDCG